MRLSESNKKLVLGNIEILKFCHDSCIDVNKLSKCNIERMGDFYVFGLDKENIPESKQPWLPLDIDIESQPDIVLTVDLEDIDNMKFETTDKTKRVLKVN